MPFQTILARKETQNASLMIWNYLCNSYYINVYMCMLVCEFSLTLHYEQNVIKKVNFLAE